MKLTTTHQQAIEPLGDDILNGMRSKYCQIRREVFTEATRPAREDAARHEANKKSFEEVVKRICRLADLKLYGHATEQARNDLWHHLWTKIKYAGIRAVNASSEITDIEKVFDKYSCFADAAWDLRIGEAGPGDSKVRVLGGGRHVQDFLHRRGDFENCRTNGKLSKLKMIVDLARRYNDFFLINPDAPAIDFVTQGRTVTDVWSIQEGLLASGYRADLTCCHLMMDLGFPVIKPDIQLTRMFLRLGWLQYAIADLPPDLGYKDLEGKGIYRSKYHYTKRSMYRPVIDLAKQIVSGLNTAEVQRDVGWCTDNPLREFDFFVVKAAQDPEPTLGIEKTLYRFGGVRRGKSNHEN